MLVLAVMPSTATSWHCATVSGVQQGAGCGAPRSQLWEGHGGVGGLSGQGGGHTYPEERLLLDVLSITLTGAQAPLGVSTQQLGGRGTGHCLPRSPHPRAPSPCPQAPAHPAHEADGLSRQEARVTDLIIHNAVKNLLLIISRKG